MVRVAIWLWTMAWLMACAPDYARTAFLCDDGHGCPAGQGCVGGRCKRGGERGDGVVCGGATCSSVQQCCIDVFNPPRCIAAGDTCPGRAALCDGTEDCQAGDRCCDDDASGVALCTAGCDHPICREADDCPAASPNCCHRDPTVTWGVCSPFPC